MLVLKGVGGLIFVAGVILWCGNMFRFFPTFPFAGYITMAVGGAIFGYAQKQSAQQQA